MKMNSGTFDLRWHSYSHHYQELMNNLLQTGDGSDVTLVCDDNVKINVHKFILKASSPVFSNIFAHENETSRETIYLRGINHLDMKSILEFIYQGNTSIELKRQEEFMTLAKDLQIRDLDKNNTEI